MICRNCRKEVDDDLVFCTECGARLFETTTQENPTIVMNESIVTQQKSIGQPKKSNLGWIALIIAFIALPVSLGIIYLIINNPSSQLADNKPTNSSTPANRKTTNQNKPANVFVNNVNAENTANNSSANSNQNTNSNSNSDKSQEQIIDERLILYVASDAAFPFTVTADNAKIIGNVEILQGDSYEGYVFSQEMYDEHHTDPKYKVFSFGETKKDEIEQYLPKGNYVVAFVNKSSKDVMIQAKFSQIPQ